MGTDTDYLGASPTAIQHHYDAGNDFYRLWLDPSMTYSCAMWAAEDDTLERAQQRKHDYLATRTRAVGAGRVLDVGFGWGAMVRRLLDTHGVGHVTGLTLSAAQVAATSAWADERCDLRLENWTDHRSAQPYDAIVSIGAMEHFANLGMSRERKIAAYRQFFASCRDWLVPGGRLGLQTIVRGHDSAADWAIQREMIRVNRWIFPESEVPWLAEVCAASEGLLEVVSVRNDAADYARTCQVWLDRLLADRERAVDLVGPATAERYERYLRVSIEVFRRKHAGLARIVFERW
ncbi:SAM-dependent methyltransferase [Nocardia brasiliensis]|uniref:SAM-dependent methyltransferase n=1 Tax=Nocardia brasiliensis TaxID=37326 RepID=UPI001894CD4D|nr:cyclopropane-fatty-acyl-phospholipid synthase family protein [Nocardia brasiliensis]MBF6542577.1 class I SAM-dependent methyltransferase [Nocardia brasiliensis]